MTRIVHMAVPTLLAIGLFGGAAGCADSMAALGENLIAAERVSAPSADYPLTSVSAAAAPRPEAARGANASGQAAEAALGGDPGYRGRLFLGARGGVNAGDGDPTNDIITYGLYGRYRLRGPFLIGFALDHANWDFEQPGHKIDVNPVGVVDTNHDETILTAWGEYEFRLADEGLFERLRPFVGVGLGVGFLSDDSKSGQIEGGGDYDIEVKGGTELIPGALFGLRVDLHRNVVIELAGRADYHFTELDVTDQVTGRRASVDDYSTFGAYLGVQIRVGE